ncbi:hypothetical protein BRAS3843_1320014 [Bradyrhizobium sp. STM 3843]|nr:hypothetical protein BRAS3843_1320014 [Bradyrhizobium sp. STM 3843]
MLVKGTLVKLMSLVQLWIWRLHHDIAAGASMRVSRRQIRCTRRCMERWSCTSLIGA